MSTNANREGHAYALLRDHSLVLESEGSCWPLVRRWLPLSCRPADEAAARRATISVASRRSPTPSPRDHRSSTLQVGTVHAWIDAGAECGWLQGATDSWGKIDIRDLHATVGASPHAGDEVGADVYFLLTVASAVLLGRMGRALIHAGAVVAPSGDGWLVVGDAQSGKSTTCVSLASTDCRLLSDDQVVLAPHEGTIDVEGWLRPVHLDEGWRDGVPQGSRRTVSPSELGAGGWHQLAPLAGTLHTSVVADRPTRVVEMSAGDAFIGLIRQSPWLLADRGAAPAVVQVLSEVARLPRYALRTGLDTFGKPDRLRTLLEAVLF